MTSTRPPTIDPVAAQRWARMATDASPWLHEEVARRMEARLQWIVRKPSRWLHWEPVRGGMQAHSLLTQRYPTAQCFVLENQSPHQPLAKQQLTPAWWRTQRWRGPTPRFALPDAPVHMLWANMALHMVSDPQALLAYWHRLLEVDGFVMFSGLGPDTLRQLRAVYAHMGWPEASHQFTDMHDWGDMLVQAGFAEPVMDMERIHLSYSSAPALLAELRTLGRNLHPQRFAALRGRAWYARLCEALTQALSSAHVGGRLELTFEVIYGHAFKPLARVPMRPETVLSLETMRQTLKQPKS